MFLNFFIVILLGLIFGSFLGVFTYRFPKKIPFVKGRSFCPKCKKQINWFDNIPLLSFIFLKGNCRHCKKKISFRYPLIEVISSISFVLIYFNYQADLFKVILFLFFYLLIASVVIIDLEEGIIPDELIFLGLTVSFFYILFFDNANSFQHLLGGFSLSSFMLLLHLLTKGKGMGLGDVKFTLFPATFLLFPFNILWLFLSFLTGSFVGVILILVKKAKFGKEIAFGPFLGVSFLITLIWGQTLLKWIMPFF